MWKLDRVLAAAQVVKVNASFGRCELHPRIYHLGPQPACGAGNHTAKPLEHSITERMPLDGNARQHVDMGELAAVNGVRDTFGGGSPVGR